MPSGMSSAPPRTRGWTLAGAVHRAEPGGSPAHAGMDPYATSPCAGTSRLPRARGDGPSNVQRVRSSVWAPPRTRGWTRPHHHPPVRHPGSPAHAGMDRRRSAGARPLSWLPRARGDGPRIGPRRGFHRWAPPRTRGWTPRGSTCGARREGSPAHAGMDPRPRLRARSRCRLPRARGDGPFTKAFLSNVERAPPRTRGWTPRLSGGGLLFEGSPAHAGMDHKDAYQQIQGMWLPRARGDEPFAARPCRLARWAPPRTRGWTRRRPRSPDP